MCTVQDLLARSWPDALKLIFWEKEVEQSLRQVHQKHVGVKAVLLMIGPEGGFSVEEAELARSHGFESVQLGRRILRAETAAVTALALVQYLWGDLA